MKGSYKRRADGELADMPPCGLCKHKNKQEAYRILYEALNGKETYLQDAMIAMEEALGYLGEALK